MKRVTAGSFKGAPRAGALVQATGKAGKRQGLEPADVVVAVDGYAVQNAAQYQVIRNISLDPAMRVVVWRAGRFVEVATRLRFDWVYGRINDYKPSPKTEPVAPAAAAAATGANR